MSSKAWRPLRAAILGLGALACAGAGAHEFFMLPEAFRLPVGGKATLSLSVGEDFQGEPIAFSRPLVAGLRRLARNSDTDLRGLTPSSGSTASIAIGLPSEGTHLISLDTHPSFVELPAEEFNAYLREDWLMDALRAREAAGSAATPGRERFRRNIKTILQAGAQADDTYRRRTGQKLELVPLQDPMGLMPPKPLTLQVWFDGRPLAGALVRLWHGHGAATPEAIRLRAVTDAQGLVTLPLTRGGAWMASVVHMVPADAGCNCDWDSYWGNLTFAVPGTGTAQGGKSSVGAPRR